LSRNTCFFTWPQVKFKKIYRNSPTLKLRHAASHCCTYKFSALQPSVKVGSERWPCRSVHWELTNSHEDHYKHRYTRRRDLCLCNSLYIATIRCQSMGAVDQKTYLNSQVSHIHPGRSDQCQKLALSTFSLLLYKTAGSVAQEGLAPTTTTAA